MLYSSGRALHFCRIFTLVVPKRHRDHLDAQNRWLCGVISFPHWWLTNACRPCRWTRLCGVIHTGASEFSHSKSEAKIFLTWKKGVIRFYEEENGWKCRPVVSEWVMMLNKVPKGSTRQVHSNNIFYMSVTEWKKILPAIQNIHSVQVHAGNDRAFFSSWNKLCNLKSG